jgi:Ser-tRNA(Ala) deacylase AlaX
MTEALYLDDSYSKEFEAKVIKSESGKIILDKTAFYPESGGQPCDFGKLIKGNKEFLLTNVRKESGEIVHYTKDGLKEGDAVKGIIDWERRHKLMRMHTAAHILSAIINLQTNALITGNQLGIEKSRIDFDLETFDRAAIQDYFVAANDVVKWNLPISAYVVPMEQIANDKKLFKLAKGLPPGLKDIRIVEIESFDKQADGGTHVKSTEEIGKIEFIDAENKGANNRRVYFKLG